MAPRHRRTFAAPSRAAVRPARGSCNRSTLDWWLTCTCRGSLTPDGRYAVFGTAEGHLQTLTADTAILTARACAMAPSAPAAASTISQQDLVRAENPVHGSDQHSYLPSRA